MEWRERERVSDGDYIGVNLEDKAVLIVAVGNADIRAIAFLDTRWWLLRDFGDFLALSWLNFSPSRQTKENKYRRVGEGINFTSYSNC